ncbi:MAG: LamG domain-containing protein [Lacipirellulaceae bacterium]
MRSSSLLVVAVMFAAAFCTPAPTAAITSLSGPVHHWKLDEATGNIATDSVAGNNGTLFNWGIAERRWVPGKIGRALDFGDADNAVFTDAPIAHDQYTIAFWLKVRAPEGINPRLVGPSDGLHHWLVIGNEDNFGVGFYYDHGAVTVQDRIPPVLNEWEHYAVTYDRAAGMAAVYRNGSEVVSGTFNDALPSGNWVFGHQGDPSNHNDSLNGLLDDIRIYDRLLLESEISNLAAIPEPSALVGGLILAALYSSVARVPKR